MVSDVLINAKESLASDDGIKKGEKGCINQRWVKASGEQYCLLPVTNFTTKKN